MGSAAPSAVVALLGWEQAPLLSRPFFAEGDPGSVVAALAHVPEALEVALPFFGMVLSPSAITGRTKEIAILRTSARASCRFCVDTHTVAALAAGLTEPEVRSLRGEGVEAVFPAETDRALIAWCDALVATGPVDAHVRDRFRAGRTDHEVVELTLLVATTLLLNRFCTGLELPTSAGVVAQLRTAGFQA